METCVIPTLLYGAENWILDEASVNLLEGFQAELGRRILKLSKYHSRLSTLIGLSWPTMKARLLKQKLCFLGKLLSDERDNIATRTFLTIASQNVYNTSVIQQCIFLDSVLGTNATAHILNNLENVEASVKSQVKSITSADRQSILQEAASHQLVVLRCQLASNVGCCKRQGPILDWLLATPVLDTGTAICEAPSSHLMSAFFQLSYY